MSERAQENNLERLERIVTAIMRVGVLVSAAALLTGLVMFGMGMPNATAVLDAGLVALMLIPASRILASFGDALVRRDMLLAGATALVAAILLWQFLRSF